MNKFLIVGLGNPGDEYRHSRHNIGFMVLDALAKELASGFSSSRLADVAEGKIKGKTVFLVKPTTFMNLSGKAVNYYLQKENIPLKNLMVITDDLALPLGKLRIRNKGSDGGHNGLKSIQETLGTSDYPRLRFGIGNEFSKGRQVDYVLGEWDAAERNELVPRIDIAVEAIKDFALMGIDKTMNAYNSK
ncbi:MAG TPA: aminoacyl-tRNA hydrolase [Bacteroidia bacterium]